MNSILPVLWRKGISASLLQPRHLPVQAWRCLTTTGMRQGEAAKATEDFFEKNKRLNRPMSPHLTIYQPQITTMLSITHRGTGLALAGLASTFAIGSLLSPSSFPVLLASLEASQLGFGMILTAKYLLAFPLFFHTFNGVRHLAWDMGKGFELKHVYASGYAVLALSFLASLAVAFM